MNTKDETVYFARVGATEGGDSAVKFSKDAQWLAGQEEVNLNGARMLADMAGLSIGWRKWIDGKIVDADIGYIAGGFEPKARSELDDLEQETWPVDSRGERNDPWQYAYFLKLVDENGQGYTWAAGSHGARRAIGNLCNAYARMRKNPIVTLDAGFYKHHTFGKINTPKLTIVGWADDAPTFRALPAPPTAPDYDPDAIGHRLDDAIPF